MGKASREKKENRLRQTFNSAAKESKAQRGIASVCLNIIKFGVFLALFAPLIFSKKFYFPFVGPKSLYFMALTQIIFFAWLILITYVPQYRPRLNILTILLILLFVFSIISSVWGENLSYSFWSKHERMTGLLMWSHLLAFFLVISSTLRKTDWLIVFSVSIFVGVILSFVAFAPDNPDMRKGATLGNSSFLGAYLIFSLFLALYLILTSKKGLKIYSAACFIIIFLGLISIQAWAATISFLGGVIFLLFLWLIFCRQGKLKWLGVFLLTIYILFIIFSAFVVFQPENFAGRNIIEKIAGPVYAETLGGRFVVWQIAWKGFLEKPFLGWGLENFEYAFAKNYNPCIGTPSCGEDMWYDRAHNIILDTLIERGALGFLLYIGVFLSVFYLLWLNYFRKNLGFWAAGIFTALLIAYFVQNLTVFDMISSYLMFFLVLGFVASTVSVREQGENDIASTRVQKIVPNIFVTVFISVLLLMFSSFYFVAQPLKSSSYVITAMNLRPGSLERLNYYQRALSISPLGKYQIREFFGQRGLEFYLTGKVKEVPAENIKQEIDFLIEELEKSAKEAPLELRSRFVLGQLYNVYSRFFDPTKTEKAEAILQEAIDISPTNQQGYWNLAQTRLYQQRFDEALALAEKALELEPKLFHSHWVVIQVAKLTGNTSLIKEKLEKALEINPEWEKDLIQRLGS